MRVLGCTALIALVGCGSPGLFSIAAKDSKPAEVAAAVQSRGPVAQQSSPMVVLAVAGTQPELVGYDLAAKRELWRAPGEVTSRVEIGGDVLVHGGTGNITARSVGTGKVLWTLPQTDTLLGLSCDGQFVAWVAMRKGNHIVNVVHADSGRLAWSKLTSAKLGAPAVTGGQVFLPLMSQWILILDGASGKRLARLRGLDHVISFVSAHHGRHVTFGSKAGVFALDERANEARSDSDVFARVELPRAFGESQYHFDGYDPVQARYSAYDRNNRVLWFPGFEQGKLRLAGNMAVTHSYRYLFGFRVDSGELTWAYSHPKHDFVASSHTGAVVGLVSTAGEIAAIDPKVGMLRFLTKVEVRGRVTGATFAALGWAPAETVTKILTPKTVSSLTAIAQDRDARFARIKKFAVSQLSNYQGQDATAELIEVVRSSEERPAVFNSAVAALVQRRDPKGLSALVDALGAHYDHVKEIEPKHVGVFARAIAATAIGRVDAAARASATKVLIEQLEDPSASATDLFDIVDALAVLGSDAVGPALRRFVILHRADPRALGEAKALERALAYLARRSTADRALVHFVAIDPRTQPQMAEKARQALSGAAVSR